MADHRQFDYRPDKCFSCRFYFEGHRASTCCRKKSGRRIDTTRHRNCRQWEPPLDTPHA